MRCICGALIQPWTLRVASVRSECHTRWGGPDHETNVRIGNQNEIISPKWLSSHFLMYPAYFQERFKYVKFRGDTTVRITSHIWCCSECWREGYGYGWKKNKSSCVSRAPVRAVSQKWRMWISVFLKFLWYEFGVCFPQTHSPDHPPALHVQETAAFCRWTQDLLQPVQVWSTPLPFHSLIVWGNLEP